MSYNFTFFSLFLTLSCLNPSQNQECNEIIIQKNIDNETFFQFLKNSHFTFDFDNAKILDDGILVPFTTKYKTFTIAIQHISSPLVIYISINDYLWLDQSKNPRSTAFALTQIAVQNHQIIGAKIQLNPQDGAITIAHEIHIPNGLDQDVFLQSLHQILEEGLRNYPMLKASLEGDGY